MRIPELRWDENPAGMYDEDLLVDIRVGRVVLLIRGRNAWHSTWVRHYLRDSTLFTDVSSAKAGAEAKRGRGNVLYIVEAPALQLVGARGSVVLCDAHPNDPFGKFTGINEVVHRSKDGDWLGGVFPGVSVRDAVSAFAHDSGYWKAPMPNEHSLRTGRLGLGVDLINKRGSLESYESQAVGVDYFLRWTAGSEGSRYTRRGANAVARSWTVLLLAAGIDDEDDADLRRRKLAQYRNEKLKAIPHSLWKARKASNDREVVEALSAAREAWFAELDRVDNLERALEEAESEFARAREERMMPAETSAEMRRQRERMEAAESTVRMRKAELTEAEQEAERLEGVYAALSVSRRG